MHWHDFGDLEGPGWAANAVGGAYQLYAWGRHQSDAEMQQDALALLDHVLHDGFIKTGRIHRAISRHRHRTVVPQLQAQLRLVMPRLNGSLRPADALGVRCVAQG